jgi:hypothetical protein
MRNPQSSNCHRCHAEGPPATFVVYNATGTAEPTCVFCAVEALRFMGSREDQLSVMATPTMRAYLLSQGGIQ